MADFVEQVAGEGYPLVPPDDELIAPSAALDEIERSIGDPALFGDLSATRVGDVVVDTQPQTFSLGRTWQFDFVKGDFVVPGAARSPVGVSGVETLRQWIALTLRTERGAHPIASDDYGLEAPVAGIGFAPRDVLASDLAQRVADALSFHPKIVEVRDFVMRVDEEDEEAVLVSFTVVLDNAESLSVEDVDLGLVGA